MTATMGLSPFGAQAARGDQPKNAMNDRSPNPTRPAARLMVLSSQLMCLELQRVEPVLREDVPDRGRNESLFQVHQVVPAELVGRIGQGLGDDAPEVALDQERVNLV